MVSKMLQHIIKNHLLHYFNQNFVHTTWILSFTRVTQVMENWTSVLESGHQVDVVYLDLQKAFDRVPHARLISKVRSYGVNGKLLQWIEDFLSNRRQ